MIASILSTLGGSLSGFKGYLILGVWVIILSLSGSLYALYSQYERSIEEKAVLEADNEAKTQQIIDIQNSLDQQVSIFETTVKSLAQREEALEKIELSNNELKSKLKEIASNEDDECINTNHGSAINDILRYQD